MVYALSGVDPMRRGALAMPLLCPCCAPGRVRALQLRARAASGTTSPATESWCRRTSGTGRSPRSSMPGAVAKWTGMISSPRTRPSGSGEPCVQRAAVFGAAAEAAAGMMWPCLSGARGCPLLPCACPPPTTTPLQCGTLWLDGFCGVRYGTRVKGTASRRTTSSTS